MTLLTGITVGIAVWALLSVLLGLAIARAIRLRDRQAPVGQPMDPEHPVQESGNRSRF